MQSSKSCHFSTLFDVYLERTLFFVYFESLNDAMNKYKSYSEVPIHLVMKYH